MNGIIVFENMKSFSLPQDSVFYRFCFHRYYCVFNMSNKVYSEKRNIQFCFKLLGIVITYQNNYNGPLWNSYMIIICKEALISSNEL